MRPKRRLQINYRGFVAGQAAAEAVVKGQALGKTGKSLDAYVQKKVDKALNMAFEKNIDHLQVFEMLRNMGEDRGYKGDALVSWMQHQLDTNENLFKRATNVSGKEYADDLLFKRAFSGKGSLSKMAKAYENAVNQHPWMRLMGQLFFRTPVRVFEEGFRLTAGLNLVSNSFRADLTGANGATRQVKAQGEALLSYALAGAVITAYANGTITGGGPSDYKQRRGLENTKDWESYSIRFANGTHFSFRNLDPFATPFKVIINAMDQIAMLEYRKAQGDNVNHDMDQAVKWAQAGVASVFQAIRDANLTEGLGQISTLVELLIDPEADESKWTRFFGNKVNLFIPNVVRKAMAWEDPMLNDPGTMEQYLRATINPQSSKVSKRYDALGNVVRSASYHGWLHGIDFTTKEMREAYSNPRELAVLNELSNLEIIGDTNFAMKYSINEPGFEKLDLRTITDRNGVPYYDRLNQKVRTSGMLDVLYEGLVNNKNAPAGTAKHDGWRIEFAKETIATFRKQAFYELIAEDSGLEKRLFEGAMNAASSKAGMRDRKDFPFQ